MYAYMYIIVVDGLAAVDCLTLTMAMTASAIRLPQIAVAPACACAYRWGIADGRVERKKQTTARKNQRRLMNSSINFTHAW